MNSIADMNDEQLMLAFQDGCNCCFDEIVNRHRERLVLFAINQISSWTVGRVQLAEDLVNESLLKAIVSARRGSGWSKGGASVATWLHTIVRNLITDHFRKRRIKTCSFSEFESDDRRSFVEPTVCSRQECRFDRRLWNILLSSIPNLPTEIRCVVELRREGLNNSSIAERLGLSKATITRRWQRAKELIALQAFAA